MAPAAAAAAAGHRGGAGGLRGAVAVAHAGGEDRHLARQMFAAALGTFRLRVAAGDQSFERALAAFTSIFVDWHCYSSSIGCAYSTSTPRAALGCRKQIIPANPWRGL